MKFGAMSPDLKFIQIEEMDDGRIRIEAKAKKKASMKTVCEVVNPPALGQDLNSWVTPHLTRIGMKLMMP